MKVIKLENIDFSYPEGIDVFKDLNFSISKGEKIGIMGANGSGKTTLFYLIMGLLKPNQGKIIAWDEERTREEHFKELRRRVGFLFQDSDDQLFAPTVEEDISFGPFNLGKNLKEVRNIVDDLCERLNIADLKKRITFKLSWGQKRLVALAGILAMEPEVLILDEPTASIDQEVRERITSYLKATDQTLLITSHDEGFLKDISSKIYQLKDSKFIPGV
ncbi:MAG: ABC transporter ATP-binding protein [Candidatus Saelkia tenebricola]|nr:ABC transporter ATP-binding protein [Candidatus Saelkia tenebricola]